MILKPNISKDLLNVLDIFLSREYNRVELSKILEA